jgi:hypothetical protein
MLVCAAAGTQEVARGKAHQRAFYAMRSSLRWCPPDNCAGTKTRLAAFVWYQT